MSPMTTGIAASLPPGPARSRATIALRQLDPRHLHASRGHRSRDPPGADRGAPGRAAAGERLEEVGLEAQRARVCTYSVSERVALRPPRRTSPRAHRPILPGAGAAPAPSCRRRPAAARARSTAGRRPAPDAGRRGPAALPPRRRPSRSSSPWPRSRAAWRRGAALLPRSPASPVPDASASAMTTSSVSRAPRFSQNSPAALDGGVDLDRFVHVSIIAHPGPARRTDWSHRGQRGMNRSNQSSIRVIRSIRRSMRPVAWITWNSSG